MMLVYESTPQKDAENTLEVNDGDMIHDPNSWKILEICVLIHFLRLFIDDPLSHRIHGAGIHANIEGGFVDGIHITIYSSTVRILWVIDYWSMGYWLVINGL